MWDIQGFLTSTEFLAQIAGIISALFSALAAGFVNALFGIS